MKYFYIFLILVLLLIYKFFDPTLNDLFPGCFFYELTGFSCPGCGLQRAAHALLNGRFLEALGHDVLAVLAVPVLAFSEAVRRYFPETFHSYMVKAPSAVHRVPVWIVVGFWVARNIPVAPFSYLAP